MNADPAVDAIQREALWFEPTADAMSPLLTAIGDARLVLIGEATHGTHEFSRTRAELTKVLISRKGFNLVAVEADWPDAYRVNRWVRHATAESDAETALGDFTRFPRWMWRNRDVVDFIQWLRAHNESQTADSRVGFYGLDLYSLHASIEAVLKYLLKVDPAGAERARYRYGCFEDFGEDTQGVRLRSEFRAVPVLRGRGRGATARLAAPGRRLRKPRRTHRGRRLLLRRAERTAGAQRRTVLPLDVRWACRVVEPPRYAHDGDARGAARTCRACLGLRSRRRVGAQLPSRRRTRDLHGRHRRTTAASNWDEPAQRKRVRPSMAGSYERLFHDAGIERFMLLLRDGPVRDALRDDRLERAIGVIYRPESERLSHYFRARLPEQFDAVLHIDHTTALESLERWAHDEVDAPETYPTGI